MSIFYLEMWNSFDWHVKRQPAMGNRYWCWSSCNSGMVTLDMLVG